MRWKLIQRSSRPPDIGRDSEEGKEKDGTERRRVKKRNRKEGDMGNLNPQVNAYDLQTLSVTTLSDGVVVLMSVVNW